MPPLLVVRHILIKIKLMIGIYCITNTLNGKRYVGQSIDIEIRWKHHRVDCLNPNASSYKTYFYQALRKYGADNFSFGVIEECAEDELDDREIYWIQTLKSNNRELGYNTTDGGDGVRGYWDKAVYQYDKKGNFIAEYKSASEAIRQTGIKTVISCCNGITKSGGGYIWSYVKHDKMPQYKRNSHTVAVYQYDLNGNFIRSFPSILEASAISGVELGNLRTCVQKNGQIRAGDFMWTRIKVDSLPPYKKNGRKSFPVIQMDLHNNVIARYDSINIASRATGVGVGCISRCCKGGAKSSGGYHWEYAEE